LTSVRNSTGNSSPTGSATAERCSSTGSAGRTGSCTGSPNPPPRPRRAKWSAGSAPRGAWLYPRRSREELEGRFLGLMAYPQPKGEGERSMPANQRPGPDVRDGALGDPRDMAKAGLPESQSPEEASSPPPERHLKPAPALRCLDANRPVATFGAMERCPVRALKEMSGTPTSRYDVRPGRTWDGLRGASPRATEAS
jgi:hypothetical protein